MLTVEPRVISVKEIQFSKTEEKTTTILKNISEIVLEDTEYLVMYERKQGIRKILHLDSSLRAMSKRKKPLAIFVYIGLLQEQANEENENPVDEDGGNASIAEGGGEGVGENMIRSTSTPGSSPDRHMLVSTPSTPDQDRLRLNSTLSMPDRLSFFGSPYRGYSPPRFNDTLPDLHTQNWQQCDEIPSGDDVQIEQVEENDLLNLKKSVADLKQRKTLDLGESLMMEVEQTAIYSEEMTAQWNGVQLNEKGRLMKEEFQDVAIKKEMSSELFTFVLLCKARESEEEIHVITPNEVTLLKEQNVVPRKPGENVKSFILIENNYNHVTSVSLVKVIENDHILTNLLTNDYSQVYTTKLIIQDVYQKMGITVQASNLNCQEIKPFPEDEERRSFMLPMFLKITTQWMKVSQRPFTLNEALLEIVELCKSFDGTSASQEGNSDSDGDWFASNERNQKRIDMLESEVVKTDTSGSGSSTLPGD